VRPAHAALGVLAALAVAVLGPATAGAKKAPPLTQSKHLWATVNVCDSVGHPDSIGIRGSMPGTGDKATELFMRFQVEYHNQHNGRWEILGPGADSGFLDVGSAKARTRQAGRTFTITPPRPNSPAYELRGMVTFEWRKDGIVVERARKRTAAGHANTAGADPPGFSAATCEIT
jgi:hypothetical protein